MGTDLRGAGQRGRHRAGDILLGQADLGDAAAVGVEVDLRLGDGLLQADIGGAGDAADLAQQRQGIGLGALAGLVPVTCTSIGAGEPKFRIWLTMSGGGKEKIVLGKIARQDSRRVRT